MKPNDGAHATPAPKLEGFGAAPTQLNASLLTGGQTHELTNLGGVEARCTLKRFTGPMHGAWGNLDYES